MEEGMTEEARTGHIQHIVETLRLLPRHLMLIITMQNIASSSTDTRTHMDCFWYGEPVAVVALIAVGRLLSQNSKANARKAQEDIIALAAPHG